MRIVIYLKKFKYLFNKNTYILQNYYLYSNIDNYIL